MNITLSFQHIQIEGGMEVRERALLPKEIPEKTHRNTLVLHLII